MQIKVRVISYQKSGEPVLGFTLPKEQAIFTKVNTLYYIERSGTSYILTSGCSNVPTAQQIKDYKFEDCKIQ